MFIANPGRCIRPWVFQNYSFYIIYIIRVHKLRDYQEIPVAKAIAYFQQEDAEPALMILPTAWGKSWLTAHVAQSIAESDRLLVVQPSKELLEQNYSKYLALCGEIVDAGIFSASFGKKEIKKITYATIGSIKELGETFRAYGFTKMLIDEAHLYPRREESMIGQFLADSGIVHVLGITATPLKLETVSSQKLVQKKDENGMPVIKDGKPEMTKMYDGYSKLVFLTNPSNDGGFYKDVIHVADIREMISGGYWSPLRYDVQPFDQQALRLNTGGSEYTEKSEKTAYQANRVHERILQALRYYQDRRRCLVFVPSVEEAERLAGECHDGAAVSGKTPKKERKRILDDFRNGRIRVVFNALLLTTGFDCPEIDCIILGASTASVARYYQTCGRGVRIAQGKRDCIIIDMCGNVPRFGKIEDIRFRKEKIWRMYGTGDNLLSGVPIECIGCFSEADVQRMDALGAGMAQMTFGKYNGRDVSDVPLGYLRWFLKRSVAAGEDDSVLLDRVRSALENDIRDTTGEQPLVMMPYGIHQEKFLVDVPRNYLRWLLSHTRWTPMNDSLKRGVELALSSERIFE